MKQRLVLYKEVKHSVHYKAVDNKDDNPVTSVYVMKKALSFPYPVVVDITIEEVKE